MLNKTIGYFNTEKSISKRRIRQTDKEAPIKSKVISVALTGIQFFEQGIFQDSGKIYVFLFCGAV
jgi:hypothetical protein